MEGLLFFIVCSFVSLSFLTFLSALCMNKAQARQGPRLVSVTWACVHEA